MPTSEPAILTPICEEIIRLSPEIKSALDIGVGIGKWGVLLREYTDIFLHWRFYKKEWRTIVDGIEIHEAYKNPVWGVYNRVFIGDAREILVKKVKHYDLIVMIDVLEHFTREDGERLLKIMSEKCKYAIVSYHNCDQKDVRDNKHEDHLSKWSDEDFKTHKKLAGTELSGVYLLRF